MEANAFNLNFWLIHASLWNLFKTYFWDKWRNLCHISLFDTNGQSVYSFLFHQQKFFFSVLSKCLWHHHHMSCGMGWKIKETYWLSLWPTIVQCILPPKALSKIYQMKLRMQVWRTRKRAEKWAYELRIERTNWLANAYERMGIRSTGFSQFILCSVCVCRTLSTHKSITPLCNRVH